MQSLHVNSKVTVVCPECSGDRKKHNSKDLVISRGERGWVYYCHHCLTEGCVPYNNTRMENNVVQLVQKFDPTALQPQHYEFLKNNLNLDNVELSFDFEENLKHIQFFE